MLHSISCFTVAWSCAFDHDVPNDPLSLARLYSCPPSHSYRLLPAPSAPCPPLFSPSSFTFASPSHMRLPRYHAGTFRYISCKVKTKAQSRLGCYAATGMTECQTSRLYRFLRRIVQLQSLTIDGGSNNSKPPWPLHIARVGGLAPAERGL